MGFTSEHTFQREVFEAIAHKPHLTPIFDDVNGAAKYLREVDPGFFIVRNEKRKKFEVHNLLNEGDTFCMLVS